MARVDDDDVQTESKSKWACLCCKPKVSANPKKANVNLPKAQQAQPQPPPQQPPPPPQPQYQPQPAPAKAGGAASLVYQVQQDNPQNLPQIDPQQQQQQPQYAEEEVIALLPPLLKEDEGKKCLVLDLDETLVHSSFRPVPNADFIISIELDNEIHHVYVLKRPFVDDFLREVGKTFEVVVFTASLGKYADPLLDMLDPHKLVRHRLFREACVQHYGNYVKDLSLLGRELNDTIIIDNSPYSYIFQPDNAIPISSWFNDPNDRQLLEILPLLNSLIPVENVTTILQGHNRYAPS